MAQKPAIYYAVVRKWWTSNNGFDILRVTSEKYHCAHGTYRNGVTRVRLDDVKAKLKSEKTAKLAMIAIKKEYQDYELKISEAKRYVTKLERERDTNIDEYLKGLQQA